MIIKAFTSLKGDSLYLHSFSFHFTKVLATNSILNLSFQNGRSLISDVSPSSPRWLWTLLTPSYSCMNYQSLIPNTAIAYSHNISLRHSISIAHINPVALILQLVVASILGRSSYYYESFSYLN